MMYRRSDLEKLLVQDFEVTWAAARTAVSRYFGESGYVNPWWHTYYHGDPVIITEWIWNNRHYWRPRRRL